MKAAPLLIVPFSEVRHESPDDCLHYESVAVRGNEMDWKIPAHRHEGLHQFQILEQGQLSGTIDGQDFSAEGPALLMMAPGSVHGFSYSRDAVGHQLTVPTGTLRGLLGDSALVSSELSASFVIALQDDREVAPLFAQLAREFNGGAAGRVPALLALATLIAVQFVRRRGEQFAGEPAPGVRDTLVQRYVALVEQHYAQQRPLEFYAQRLGVTSDHLSRTCRNVAGRSALQIAHDRLLLEARRLLAYTALPVSRIAHQLGYADTAYFTKFFGRSVGHTPSEYRALVAQGVRSAGA
jgi:AraC family transcriptional regulator, transcriptional activator of pobA